MRRLFPYAKIGGIDEESYAPLLQEMSEQVRDVQISLYT